MHHLFLDQPGGSTTVAEITTTGGLLTACEDERCEFKAARSHFDFSKLADYCAALSNEGGGTLVLGVSDALPRQAVGTQAFAASRRPSPMSRSSCGSRSQRPRAASMVGE